MVDIFRSPEFLPEIIGETIAVKAKTIWTQLGVVGLDDTPEQNARAAGLHVVSNKCIRTEHERLGIEPKQE